MVMSATQAPLPPSGTGGIVSCHPRDTSRVASSAPAGAPPETSPQAICIGVGDDGSVSSFWLGSQLAAVQPPRMGSSVWLVFSLSASKNWSVQPEIVPLILKLTPW